MKVDGNGERLDQLPERQVPRIVEIKAVGMAVDERAPETELPHAALELPGGGIGLLHGQMREPRITRRVLRDLGREKVVGPVCLARRPGMVVLGLHARRVQRQHREVDPGFVHCSDSELGKIRQTRGDRAQEPRLEQVCADLAGMRKAVGPEMLFERDLFHCCSPATPAGWTTLLRRSVHVKLHRATKHPRDATAETAADRA